MKIHWHKSGAIVHVNVLPVHKIDGGTICRNCRKIISYHWDPIVWCSKECKKEYIKKLENYQ